MLQSILPNTYPNKEIIKKIPMLEKVQYKNITIIFFLYNKNVDRFR